MAQCVSECHASSHFKLSFIFISIYFCFLLQLCLHTKIQREKKRRLRTQKKCKKKESKTFLHSPRQKFLRDAGSAFLFLLLLLLSCATRCGKIFICFSFSLFIIPTSLKYFCLQKGARAVVVVAVVFMAVAVFSGVPSEMFDLYFICCRMWLVYVVYVSALPALIWFFGLFFLASLPICMCNSQMFVMVNSKMLKPSPLSELCRITFVCIAWQV